jgi:hypothetical protein
MLNMDDLTSMLERIVNATAASPEQAARMMLSRDMHLGK